MKHAPRDGRRRRFRNFLANDLRPLLILALAVFAFRSAVADWNDVPTGSMKPTILEGDRIFVNKLAYDLKVPFTRLRLAEWADPARGDIVVCLSPHDGIRLVKRVIGLPGDTIELRANRLVVNGETVNYAPLAKEVVEQLPASERTSHVYASEQLGLRSHAVMGTPRLQARRDVAPLKVPEDRYFVMGDNRDNSLDSRVFGGVPRKDILGRASFVAISLDKQARWRPRWNRFLSKLD